MSKPDIDPRRNTLREIIATLPTIVQGEFNYRSGIYHPVQSWPSETVNLLGRLRAETHRLNDPALEASVRGLLHNAITQMRSRQAEGMTDAQIIVATKSAISQMSVDLAGPVSFRDYESFTHNFIPWEQVQAEKPGMFNIRQTKLNGVDVKLVAVSNSKGKLLGDIVVPNNPRIKVKGGPPRAAGKAYFGCENESYLEAEFPPSDYDVLIEGDDPNDYHQAESIGCSNDGIEFVSPNFSFGEYCAGRDVEPNQIYLDTNGIHYSNEARESLITGVFSVSGKYVRGKALFGSDVFPVIHQGDELYLYKPRASSRIGKFLVEGKMRAAHFRDISGRFFDFRLYSLFLINRWQKKVTLFPVYAQRLFHIMEQMGQTSRGEHDIMQLLESAHRKYNFFKFDNDLITPQDVTEWYLRKLAKQVDRDLAIVHGLSSGFEIIATRKELEAERLLSLDGFHYQPQQAKEFLSWFPSFKERCAQKVKQLPPQSNVQRIFFSGVDNEVDADDLALAPIIIR